MVMWLLAWCRKMAESPAAEIRQCSIRMSVAFSVSGQTLLQAWTRAQEQSSR